MELREFINNLNKLIAEHPEALHYDVVTSKDLVGIAFNLTPLVAPEAAAISQLLRDLT